MHTDACRTAAEVSSKRSTKPTYVSSSVWGARPWRNDDAVIDAIAHVTQHTGAAVVIVCHDSRRLCEGPTSSEEVR